jgi:hypothetical protein
MKTTAYFITGVLAFLMLAAPLSAQEATDTTKLIYKVTKQNGITFTGRILSQDSREVLVDSKEMGQVFIPKHEIRDIAEFKALGKVQGSSLFSTRYFLTTNGFPVKKGDNYVQWNLFGPDFQFGIANNFGVGIMTSWVGMPIIGTAKYTLNLGKNFCGGLGFLGGTGSWAFPEYGLLLPFGFLTVGNRINNLNVSAGYGALFAQHEESYMTIIDQPTDYSTNQVKYDNRTVNESEGRFLWSVAGMCRLNGKFSFVFDSFMMVKGKDRTVQVVEETRTGQSGKVTYSLKSVVEKQNPIFVLCPGIRFQANERSSFQFGFTGIHFDGEFVPVPVPMVQWFVKI